VILPRLRSDAAAERDTLQRASSLLLLDRAKIQAWQRLLFIECGDGWIVEEAWRRVRRGYVCGVDTSAALVDRATALRGVPGALEFKLWDGSRLPCPSGFFQSVLSTVALDRCSDPAEVLGAMLHGAGFQEVIQGAIPVEGGEDVGAVIMHARATPLAARPRSTPDR